MPETMRYGLLLRTALEVLRDSGGRMLGRDVISEVAAKLTFTSYESEPSRGGTARWETALRFDSGDAATAGWMVKRVGAWWITDAGRAILVEFSSPDELIKELRNRYRQIYRDRKQARKLHEGSYASIASAIDTIPLGSWTSYDDLGELVDLEAASVRSLIPEFMLPGNYRVLHHDGRIPEAMYQHVSRRGDDLQKLLEDEGVEFNDGLANQAQRITADLLRERLAETVETELVGRRAWLVRGSNVEGLDLVGEWLVGGWVSLAASQLPAVDESVTEQRIRELVAAAYRHKSYSVREKLTSEFDAFLRRMGEGDYLLTVHRGEAYLGVIDGEPEFIDSGDHRSNLRRSVRWLNADEPIDLTELKAPLPTLIQSQDDVVDLTDGLASLDRLYAPFIEEVPLVPAPAEARLADVTPELADELLIDDIGWLQEMRDLLADRRQLILYGPPGTGKTFLAQRLASRLTESHAVKLIQFHPSYTYEDFFEGFRPESSDDGTLKFRLTDGPLRKLADDAREHPSTAYILIIDEINRGNLAKIFGELYFLLEYRDQRIGLQYSREDFTLPTNLYLIGTMNTADRSIARVDAAMRRRFAFVEMHPTKTPVGGLLRRWLTREGIASDAADMHDALNARLSDADYAIGPSYFMRASIYAKPDGLASVWRHDLLPMLVEHHYADDIDVEARYGFDALRADMP
jgi:5-methylcytosine-specific restriction enzyme B